MSDKASIHPAFPTVVMIDGAWTEVSCGLCGSNYNQRDKVYFLALKGLRVHYMKCQARPQDNINWDLHIARCEKRIVSDSDAERMARGEEPEVSLERKYVRTDGTLVTKAATGGTRTEKVRSQPTGATAQHAAGAPSAKRARIGDESVPIIDFTGEEGVAEADSARPCGGSGSRKRSAAEMEASDPTAGDQRELSLARYRRRALLAGEPCLNLDVPVRATRVCRKPCIRSFLGGGPEVIVIEDED